MDEKFYLKKMISTKQKELNQILVRYEPHQIQEVIRLHIEISELVNRLTSIEENEKSAY